MYIYIYIYICMCIYAYTYIHTYDYIILYHIILSYLTPDPKLNAEYHAGHFYPDR